MRISHASKILFGITLAGLLACSTLGVCSEIGGIDIAVFCSHRASPYDETLEGFKAYLASQGISANLKVRQLDGDDSKATAAIDSVKREKPRMVLTLGAFATGHALSTLSDLPIVAGLVLTAGELQTHSNATGVILDFPIETQFQWLGKLLPKCRKIGVLYNADGNSQKIKAASDVAQRMGLKLSLRKVETPSGLPDALDAFAGNVDVIWGIPDEVVFTPQTAKHILLFSFRSGIPIVGLSDAWVRAGALYALEWDYRDLGQQCGEIVEEILKGKAAGSIRPRWPRKVKCSFNQKTATRLNIDVPEGLLKSVSTLHE